jgi:phosphoserine phosphatase RsbU/P
MGRFMARIVLLKDGQSFPYELKSFPARMGRHPDCNVQVDSNMVSRFHAQLVQIDGKIMLEDLASGNGSSVNGKPWKSISLILCITTIASSWARSSFDLRTKTKIPPQVV